MRSNIFEEFYNVVISHNFYCLEGEPPKEVQKVVRDYIWFFSAISQRTNRAFSTVDISKIESVFTDVNVHLDFLPVEPISKSEIKDQLSKLETIYGKIDKLKVQQDPVKGQLLQAMRNIKYCEHYYKNLLKRSSETKVGAPTNKIRNQAIRFLGNLLVEYALKLDSKDELDQVLIDPLYKCENLNLVAPESFENYNQELSHIKRTIFYLIGNHLILVGDRDLQMSSIANRFRKGAKGPYLLDQELLTRFNQFCS